MAGRDRSRRRRVELAVLATTLVVQQRASRLGVVIALRLAFSLEWLGEAEATVRTACRLGGCELRVQGGERGVLHGPGERGQC